MKRLFVSLIVGMLIVFSVSATALAAQPQLNYGQELNAAQCGGQLVINITEKIVNDIDSGYGGNYWASDTFNRQIQVRQVGDGTYCAIVSYEGQFTSVAGTSPSGTSTISAGITGTIQGGYVSTMFTGDFAPTAPTQGQIGTYDYHCDAATGTCSGAVDWTTLYFSSTSGFDLEWWGWIYRAGANGTWVNAIDSPAGGLGDITG